MTTIPQNEELLKNLFALISAQRGITDPQRVYERLEMLIMAELFTFGRHTITQMLMSLGLNNQDWSGWYRLFSEERFNYEAASEGLFAESLRYVAENDLYVVAGDATQTPRSSRKLEGSGWLRNLRTPPGGHSCGAALVQRQLAHPARERLQPGGAVALAARFHRKEPTADGSATQGVASECAISALVTGAIADAGSSDASDFVCRRWALRQSQAMAAVAAGGDADGAKCQKPCPVPLP